MPPRPYALVLSNPDLRLLLTSQALATVGSRFFDVTLLWLAVGASDDYNAAGFIIFFRFLPYALLGLVGGWVSDRFDRKRIVVVSDMSRALLLLSLSLLLHREWATVPLLAGTAFLLTVARTFFQPAIQGLLPDMAPRELIQHANSALHALNELTGIVAPILAGAALAFMPPQGLVAVTGLLFFLAAICILMLSRRQTGGAEHIAGRGLSAVRQVVLSIVC